MTTPSEKLLDMVEWVACEVEPSALDPNLPVATHRGVWNIFGVEVECFRLSNGLAVISADGMNAFMRALSGGA